MQESVQLSFPTRYIEINRNTVNLPHALLQFCGARFSGIKTHKIGRIAKALAQWCTAWHRQPKARVQNLGINLRVIMCLLDHVVLGVQALR